MVQKLNTAERRAALVGPVGADGSLHVTDVEMKWALADLADSSESLTHRLLGGQSSSTDSASPG